jgi:hypothetical protein
MQFTIQYCQQFTRLMLLPAAIAIAVHGVSAQCSTQWLAGDGMPGLLGHATASTMWDPDDAGPAAPVLVVGGQFSIAGTVGARNIATYDLVTAAWSPLGDGLPGGSVDSVTMLPNGDLIAGDINGQVQRWDGASWLALGSGMNGSIDSLGSLANGDLAAAGSFTMAGGVAANRVAYWTGSAWAPLGTGMDDRVRVLQSLPSGELVAAGSFTTADGVAAAGVASWDGASWTGFGSGLVPGLLGVFVGGVQALAQLPNGNLVAAGSFANVAGGVVQWDGTNWSALSWGWFITAHTLAVLPSGDVVVSAGGVLARYDGTSWSALPSLYGALVRTTTVLPTGELFAGGRFSSTGTERAEGVALHDGTAWAPMAPDTHLDGRILAMSSLAGGDVVVGGDLINAGPVALNGIARYDHGTWSPMGSGFTNTGPNAALVMGLVTLPNQDVVACGLFTHAGGVAANSVARWNGTSWSALGAGVSGARSLASSSTGELVATSATKVLRWDGVSWVQLGSDRGFLIRAMAFLDNGDLVAVGAELFGSADVVERWDGATWSSVGGIGGIGGSLNGLAAVAATDGGGFVVAGRFGDAGGVRNVARWDGASWSWVGTSTQPWTSTTEYVTALAVLPNGDLIATGKFGQTGASPVNNIARFDGATWSSIDTGLTERTSIYSDAEGTAIAVASKGDVIVGGTFAVAGPHASIGLATLTTSCPATAIAFGNGCIGSGGLEELQAQSLPWTGSTYTTEGTGLPQLALTIDVRGLATASLPLASILPQGVVGCSLLASPDLLNVYVPSAGRLVTTFVIPNLPVLVGQAVHQQLVSLEVDAVGSILAMTSTNGLSATIGSF